MARVCQLSGKHTRSGNNVSHANNRTKRKFYPNLHRKRFFSEELGEWVTLKVAASTIRDINKKGFDLVVKEAIQKGTARF